MTRYYDYKEASKIQDEYRDRFCEHRLECDYGRTLGEVLGQTNAQKLVEFLFGNNNTKGQFIIRERGPVEDIYHRRSGLLSECNGALAAIGAPADSEFIFSPMFKNLNMIDTHQMRLVKYVNARDIVDVLTRMVFSDQYDTYISVNTSCGFSSANDAAFSLRCIVADIDCHRNLNDVTPEEFRELCAKFRKDLVAFFPTELCPNIISLSGRGLHVFWRVEQCSAKLGWMLQGKIYDLIKAMLYQFLSAHSEYSCFSIDDCYKTNLMHIFRIPGTYNTKAGMWGDVTLVHENIMDANALWRKLHFAVYGEELPVFNREARRSAEKEHKKSLKARAHVAVYQDEKVERKTVGTRSSKRGFANLLNSRCALIEYVVNRMPAHKGFRNKLLYNYLYAAVQCHKPETADEMARNLNSQFSEPLRDSEVRSICAALKKNTFYQVGAAFQNMKQYKQKTWLGFFQSIPGFEKYYNEFVEMKKRRAEEKKRSVRHQKSMENVTKKLNRDEQIRVLAAKGYAKTVIAAAVGVCRKTVYNVLNKVRAYAEKAMNLIVGAPQLVAAPI